MRSVLLVAALLSSTAGAAFAELQSIHGLPEGLIVGTDGLLYVDPNAGKLRAAAGTVPGTVIGPDAAGRYLNLRAPGGPQRQGRTLTNTDDPLAVLALPFDGEGLLLDLANPFSGDGFGSRGSVGRGFTGKTTAAPGRWLTDTADGVGTTVGTLLATTTHGAVLGAFGATAFLSEGAVVPAALIGASAGGLALGFDALNPWSGDGFGSRGSVGRGFVPYGAAQQAGAPDQFLQQASAPGRWLTETTEGVLSLFGSFFTGTSVLATAEMAAALGSTTPAVAAGAGLAGAGIVTLLGDVVNPWSGDGFGSTGAAGRSLGSPVAHIPLLSPIVPLDNINPWSGDGVGSPGVVGRVLVPYGAGQQVGGPDQFLQQASAPGRWLEDTAGGAITMFASTFGGAGTVMTGVGMTAVDAVCGVLCPAGAAIAMSGALTDGLDYINPLSGDGFGSHGNVGRGIADTPQVVLNGAGQVIVPGRWLSTNGGAATAFGSMATGAAIAASATAPVLATAGAGLMGAAVLAAGVDYMNPWSGDGGGDFGSFGRGLTVPVGVAGQMPYYSTGNAGMVPVQYDVGPQGTTISITIPNGYNLGQMGMMPMVPAMSAPQYRVIPQYAAPAPVAYAAPAPVAYAAPTMPANLAVAPVAANAGVKCQVGDQQALALTVDACEEAGGLVQPMDAAQAAE
jgi:hypothetical protein